MNPRSAHFTHISGPPGNILKEIARRAELCPWLEVEMGRALSDEEFIVLAERSGIRV